MKAYANQTANSLLRAASDLSMHGRHDDAEALLRNAVDRFPESDEVWVGLVSAMEMQNRKRDAFLKTIEWLTYRPRSFMARLQHFSRSLNFCQWSRYHHDVECLKTFTSSEGYVIGETALTVPEFSHDLLVTWTERYATSFYATSCLVPAETENRRRYRQGKLRIGFLGQDFHGQATNYLMIGFVEAHDRERFEFIAYDYGPNDGSDLRYRSLNAYDQFRHLNNATNQEIENVIRGDNLDVLLFLQSVANPRLQVLASRPAPIQLAYLYFPGPFNFGFMDGIVADDFVIPEQLASSYRCPIWRLSGCYQPNDSKRYIPGRLSKASLGLSEDTFVFANFNAPHKTNPFILNLWAEILKNCPSSVMLLLSPEEQVEENLRTEFLLRGIPDERLRFSGHMPSKDHLARLSVADLILDSFPYGGHTLASDALWAGAPVLTLCGESFSSRVAGSLLRAVSLNQLITYSPEEYVQRAIELCRNREWIGGAKEYLVANRGHFDLFNPVRYAREFERLMVNLTKVYDSTPLRAQ